MHETPWMTHDKRSDTSVLVLMGDSHAMHWNNVLRGYAEAINVSYMLATRGNPPAGTWISGVVELEVPRDLAEYSNRLIVLHGRATPDVTVEAFNRTLSFWAQVGYVVVIADEPMLPLVIPDCLKQKSPEECNWPLNQSTHGLDKAFYEKLVTQNPDLLENTFCLDSLRDFVTWEGLVHSHVYDNPTYRDQDHWSTPFLRFIEPHFLHRFLDNKCVQYFWVSSKYPKRVN